MKKHLLLLSVVLLIQTVVVSVFAQQKPKAGDLISAAQKYRFPVPGDVFSAFFRLEDEQPDKLHYEKVVFSVLGRCDDVTACSCGRISTEWFMGVDGSGVLEF